MFATADPQSGLWSVPATGGEPRMLTRPDPQRGEADHVLPSFLPGGTSVLFTITTGPGSMEESSVAVLDLKDGHVQSPAEARQKRCVFAHRTPGLRRRGLVARCRIRSRDVERVGIASSGRVGCAEPAGGRTF